MTYVENLPGIVRCGLVPGGIGGGNRLALHCGKTTLRNLRVGDPIAIIYSPSATLARYGAGVAFNGTFMVFDVIPIYEAKSIWIGKSNKGKCLEIEDVKRAYSTCVENEICPGFVGSSQESAIIFLQNIAKVIEESPETEAGADNLHYIREMVDRACKLFRGGAREELETLTNDIRDEISKIIILNDETWEGLRCRICPSCAFAIPTYFCICLECEAQLILTGRFCVNIDSDDDDHKPNVSGGARRAQEEANDNAAAQEKDGGMEDDPEDDDMGTQEETSGYVSEEEDNEWNYRDNDMAARDIINCQNMAICMDEPREAQYMAGFIALQMSRLWGMFEAGEKRANDAALEGIASCPYHNNLGHYPNITEVDRDGSILPSTEHKISLGERTQYIRYLDVTRDEMKLLVSERRHPVGYIVYRCFSPAFKYIYPSRGPG